MRVRICYKDDDNCLDDLRNIERIASYTSDGHVRFYDKDGEEHDFSPSEYSFIEIHPEQKSSKAKCRDSDLIDRLQEFLDDLRSEIE